MAPLPPRNRFWGRGLGGFPQGTLPSSKVKYRMQFSSEQVSAFEKASLDRNPLHVDADYARRTPFGKPVVYGMCGVIAAIGSWAAGKTLQLESIRVVFRKPLFRDTDYRLEVKEEGSKAHLKLRKGPVEYCSIVLTRRECAADFPSERGEASAARSRPSVDSEAPMAARTVAYTPDLDPALLDAFGLRAGQLPAGQLSALVWSSYHVGMELPGQQALYAELEMEFGDAPWTDAAIRLDLEPAAFDDRFNRVTIRGSGSGIERLRILAFRRPAPVDYPLAALRPVVGDRATLRGKRVFVSGASRGFGAAMAKVAALHGADLALNYRSDAEGMAAVRDELEAAGTRVHCYPADLADPHATEAMAASIRTDLSGLDLIVNSAAPPIRDLFFLEQGNEEFLEFVRLNLSISLETARSLLPLVERGGRFLHVSTTYLSNPVRAFSHYLTAKHAQEGLVQALSLEFRDVDFLVARLPRILTDQTNLPFDMDPPRHAGEVAHALLEDVASREPGFHFALLEGL